jgi:6,7-dimethyl-8-ribityllumazine synthase
VTEPRDPVDLDDRDDFEEPDELEGLDELDELEEPDAPVRAPEPERAEIELEEPEDDLAPVARDEEAWPDDEHAWPDDEHAVGELDVPDAVDVIEGAPRGGRRRVAIVVSRFNGHVTNLLLRRALLELEDTGISPSLVTVMPVPGAFELPLGAMALAKTRKFACVIALGCVVRGETPHFDYVAGEAASGLQLAALETGVPVSFGVLTVESVEQAEARLDRARDAVRSALEMADVFAQLRSAAAA